MMTLKTLALALATLCLGAFASGSTAEAQYRFFTVQQRVVSPTIRRAPVVSPTRRVAPTAPAPIRVAPAPAARGELTCRVTENGAPTRATLAVRTASGVLTSDCAAPVSLPAGTYVATITLETAIDRPTRSVRVTVPSGGSVAAQASFQTAILEVRFTANGVATHGRAIIERDGQVIGSIASNVVTRVSAGRYQVRAQYLTQERLFTVDLVEGQRRAVQARF